MSPTPSRRPWMRPAILTARIRRRRAPSADTTGRTHVVSGIYEPPFGRGRAPAFLQRVIGDWQLNALIAQQSGGRWDLATRFLLGSIKDIPLPGDQRSVDRWFNTDVFERSSAGQLASHYRTFPRYL